MDISTELRKILLDSGASIVGFTDISNLDNKSTFDFDYAISIALALDPKIVNNLSEGVTSEYEIEYINANEKLDKLSILASKILIKNGYKAKPQIIKDVVVNNDLRSILPHKTIATQAGIGWIGKSALLVTDEFGSAIRLSSVLTNAKLDVSNSIIKPKCGSCSKCKIMCPGKAVIGYMWDVTKKREDYYIAHKCRLEARRRSGINDINRSLCGVCIVVCPYTQKYIEASNIRYKGNDIKNI